MQNLEFNYRLLIKEILAKGDVTTGRNGDTISIFGKQLEFKINKYFPLLTGRKIFYKGVLGEMAAFLRGPKNIKDFEKWGCNYWKLWADENGNLDVDYGNQWLDFNGINQVDAVIKSLKENPYGRRHIISSWRPDNIEKLSLPCCHYNYQFNVSNGKLDLLCHQRSVDVAVGLPSDFALAALMVILFANETDLIPGKVVMSLGNTHIYSEHLEKIDTYLNTPILTPPTYKLNKIESIYDFEPKDLEIFDYNHGKRINFKLKE